MSFHGSSKGFLLLTMRMFLPLTLMWLSSAILQNRHKSHTDAPSAPQRSSLSNLSRSYIRDSFCIAEALEGYKGAACLRGFKKAGNVRRGYCGGSLDVSVELAQGGVVLQQVGGLLHATCRQTALRQGARVPARPLSALAELFTVSDHSPLLRKVQIQARLYAVAYR